jgi:glycosyltransferase involved in cell wall biosynthesis
LTDIALVASNSVIRHPRIWKIVNSLQKRYNVSVLGWNREGVSPQDINEYISHLTLFRLKAPFGKPSLIVYYPLFWTWIFFKLLAIRPNVVHSIDLDTLIPCCVYKLIFRKKLLYDVHDRFGGYVPSKYRTLFNVINSIEELLSKRVDTLVTVSKKVQHTFKCRPKDCAIIMNLSEDYEFKKLKSHGGILTLVYTGLITKDQGLERILSAIKGVTGVELILAGRVHDKALLDQMQRLPNIVYRGLLERTESLKLESSSDVMMVLYDLQYRKNQLSSPNKIFEAMMCGIPLITNMEKSLVKEIDCGIIVDYDNLDEIRNAIITLRDRSDLRRRLGENGRKAFVEKYNWNNMEIKLYEIYNNLLKE